MGFFVKNVENVQGDERDVIIFSSTFGRNAQGAFRRAFGVLGQVGGERRLNVAVTRASETVVLVTSMPIAEISDFLSTRRQAPLHATTCRPISSMPVRCRRGSWTTPAAC
jgi:primosomal replication protein N''